MSKVDVLMQRQRLPLEEGRRRFAFNDATGQRVTCRPGGNLTIAEGVNLEVGLDDEEIDWLSRHRAEQHDHFLSQFTWYVSLSDVVGSVPLDIAFNAGDWGEVHKFPKMIAAFERGDIAEAANQCRVLDPRLDAQRYAPLRQILLDSIRT